MNRVGGNNCYRLVELDHLGNAVSYMHSIHEVDNNKQYRLEIKAFPPNNNRRTNLSKTKFNDLNEMTEKCIDILVNVYRFNRKHIVNGNNIFCPVHENEKTSKSPSARYNINDNYIICFSGNCSIPRNKNGNKTLNSYQLYKVLVGGQSKK